jgi:predicted dehydrogenase
MTKSKLSRRDFIRRTTSAAGATLAAKTILVDSGPSYAQNAAVPPSDRLHIGIIGVGEQGSGLLRSAISLPGIECVAACDLWDGRHTLAQEIVGKPIKVTRRYQELLDDKEIDCIINGTPDFWHKQILVDCCNAGKDVYSEKPMSHNASEGFEMIAAAERNKRIVQIGSQAASSWTFIKAKELIAQGAIGDLHTIEASTGRNTPNGAWASWMPPPGLSPQNLDWDTWLGNTPKLPFDPIRFARWRSYRDYGTGVAGDLMVHLLTGMHLAAGVTDPPQRALSVGALYVFKDGREAPDVHHVLYDYPNFKVIIKLMLTCEFNQGTKFYGTRGLLEVTGGGAASESLTLTPQDGMDHGPGWYQQGYPRAMREAYEKQWHLDHDAQLPKEKPQPVVYKNPNPWRDGTRDHLQNFFDAVRSRKPVVEDCAFGNNTALACHMANASYYEQSIAVWDATAQRIRT